MISRRSLFGALALVPFLFIGDASADDVTYYNRDGVPVTFNKQMVEDIQAIYKIDFGSIIPNMRGTSFTVVKEGIERTENNIFIRFSIFSNDPRDKQIQMVITQPANKGY